MDLPVEISSRLAEVESQVDQLSRLLAGTRNRSAEASTLRAVRFVRTAERDAVSGHGYPDNDDAELPILFLDTSYSSPTLSRSTRSEYPRAVVFSQWGWLPPELELMVAPGLNDRYLVACRPPLLHGKVYSGGSISAGSWSSDCGTLTPTATTVQIYRENGSGDYVAQEYSNGDPVLMAWQNVGDAITAGVLISAAINADNQWIASPESCDGCSPAYGSGS